ncbi:MAG: 4-alpha-glucanotransferase, partial [bacterium]|nr:4-alpha-glucanotransferase [bacterium]
MKEKGILLPIYSLPSKYGIGDFGYEAYEFIDILSENNIKYWEILPINQCNKHPYSPISYYALEEDYISLDKLKEQGLIRDAEKRENKDRVIYDNFKEKYYKEAFNNFEENKEYKEFIQLQEINQYAEFISEKTE